MGVLAAGSIVTVRFPFSDLSASKVRPAVVLADAGRDDFILCQITSRPYADSRAISINQQEFASGSLERISYVRYTKLFTANSALITETVGALQPATLQKIVSELIELLQGTPKEQPATSEYPPPPHSS